MRPSVRVGVRLRVTARARSQRGGVVAEAAVSPILILPNPRPYSPFTSLHLPRSSRAAAASSACCRCHSPAGRTDEPPAYAVSSPLRISPPIRPLSAALQRRSIPLSPLTHHRRRSAAGALGRLTAQLDAANAPPPDPAVPVPPLRGRAQQRAALRQRDLHRSLVQVGATGSAQGPFRLPASSFLVTILSSVLHPVLPAVCFNIDRPPARPPAITFPGPPSPGPQSSPDP